MGKLRASDTKLAVLISGTTPTGYRWFLREREVPYFEVGDRRVDLRQAVDRLAEAFGADCIVSTAGGVLNGALLRVGLVDEIDIQLLPAVVGRPDAPAICEGYELGVQGSLCGLSAHLNTKPTGRVHLHPLRGALTGTRGPDTALGP